MEHGAGFYLISWFGALASAIGLFLLVLHIPYLQRARVRHEDGRTSAAPIIFRLGGFLLAFVFLTLLLLDQRLEGTPSYWALWVGTLGIMAFSIVDDLSHVLWPWHLGFQLLLAGLVFSSGMKIQLGGYFPILSSWDGSALIGLLLVSAWIVLVMNAVNWIDGMDGLMPGVAALSFASVFFLSLQPEVNQPAVGILSIMLFALALGLLFFNWYPARILAGTGGAYFFGFALAVLGLYAGMKVATLLLVLIVPVFDALFVVSRRLFLGRAPFHPDEEHLHHLLRSFGWGPGRIAATYLILTAAMSLLALSLEGDRKILPFAFGGITLFLISILLNIFFREKSRAEV